jgi:tetratricopeptide (TPR) repeat protein
MIRKLSLFFTLLCALLSNAQTADSIDYKKLYNAEKYNEVISKIPKKAKELDAISLYYIGMAYYMKSNDIKALEYLDLALDKGPVDHDMYYYKGMIYFYGKKYKEALKYVNKAIALRSSESEFYYTKAEIFQAMDNQDSAISNGLISSNFPKTKTKSLILLGELFQENKDYVKALNVYQQALERIKPGNEKHKNVSFNLGLMMQLNGKFLEGKKVFKDHCLLYTEDYLAISKLIQMHHALNEYDSVAQYKSILYEAYKFGKLEDQMKVIFCIDQFSLKGKKIMVFERFAEFDKNHDTSLYNKYQFYVLDLLGKIQSSLDLETSIMLNLESGKQKYVLCYAKEGTHITNYDMVFYRDTPYKELKSSAMEVLNTYLK